MTCFDKVLAIATLFSVACFSSAQQPYSSAGTRVPAMSTREQTLGVVVPSSISAQGVAQTPLSPLSTTLTAGPVQIGPGDLLEIGVFDTPELAGKVRVNSHGEITLPLIGIIAVGGLSPEEVQDVVACRLRQQNFVKNPQVYVFVTEYASQVVYVTGEVVRPGPYPLMGSHRLLDFISAAGGFAPRAGKTVTLLVRGDSEHPRILELGSSGKDSNPELSAGDSISVAQMGLIYVLGEVRRPGGFLLNREDSLTVMQSLALAEGILPTAAKSSAKLIRTTAKGRDEIPLNLEAILKSRTTDFAMQDNDILFVPGSTAKGIWKGLQNVFPAATSATIYRAP